MANGYVCQAPSLPLVTHSLPMWVALIACLRACTLTCTQAVDHVWQQQLDRTACVRDGF